MNKVLKQAILAVSCVVITALTLCSCGKKSEYDYEYLAVKMSKGEGWSIIDKNGKVVVNDEYPSDATLSAVYDGVYWVQSGNTYQLFSVDNPKRPIVDEGFTRATDFHAGRAVVSAPNQPIKVIDTKGKVVATLDKDIKRCYPFSENGYAVIVSSDNKYGVIDQNGKVTIKPEYAYMEDKFSDGVVLASKQSGDNKFSVIDGNGKELGSIDSDKYSILGIYSEDKILVMTNDDNRRFVVLDKSGNKLFEIKKAGGYIAGAEVKYVDGYIVFSNDEGRYGIANDKGEDVIRAKYNSIMNLGNGEFAVQKDGKWGIVDADDNVIIDLDYDFAIGFTLGGNYCVEDGNEYLIVKKDNKNTVLTSFSMMSYSASDYAKYIDASIVVNRLVEYCNKFEKPLPVSQISKFMGMSPSSYRRKQRISDLNERYEDVAVLSVSMNFDDYVTKDITHKEKVSYGLYSYDKTVVDGWEWTDAMPTMIELDISAYGSSNDLNWDDVYKAVRDQISKGCQDITDNEEYESYLKTIKDGNNSIEVSFTFEQRNNGMAVYIGYARE